MKPALLASLTALAAAIVGPVLAQDGAPARLGAASPAVEETGVERTQDVSAAPAGVYRIDPSHTAIIFTVSHMGFSNYAGRFNEVDATLTLDPADPAKSRLEVSIPTASIDVNHAKLSPELAGDRHLNAAAHPAITFTATGIERTSDTTGTVTGDLTLLGVSQPVTLDVTFNGLGVHPLNGKTVLGFSATGTLTRSDFGYTAMAQAIGDTVHFQIETEFQLAD